MIRDILLGLLTWVLTLTAMIGTAVLCHWLWAPPMADRGRNLVFMIGGIIPLFIALAIFVLVVMVLPVKATDGGAPVPKREGGQ